METAEKQDGTALPGGQARRPRAAGLQAGARRTYLSSPTDALALVADDLVASEAVLVEQVGSDVAALPHVAHYLAAAGGKRLRPALTALAARALGASVDVHALMAAGELIHLGSLLHDDVVDDGTRRRGQPTANVLHGNAISVLTGDFCVGRALTLALTRGGALAGTELAQTVATMSEGEVLQLQLAGNLQATVDGYMEVIERKTSSLISWCTAAPALAAGDAVRAEALRIYGCGVGVAFQIADDVLDFREGTGKAPGADLRERKLTLPILLAGERVPALMEALATGHDWSDETLAYWVAQVRASGALEAALDVALGHVEQAIAALDALPDNDGTDAMRLLATFLVERTA